jgi:hypothetical protein
MVLRGNALLGNNKDKDKEIVIEDVEVTPNPVKTEETFLIKVKVSEKNTKHSGGVNPPGW